MKTSFLASHLKQREDNCLTGFKLVITEPQIIFTGYSTTTAQSYFTFRVAKNIELVWLVRLWATSNVNILNAIISWSVYDIIQTMYCM